MIKLNSRENIAQLELIYSEIIEDLKEEGFEKQDIKQYIIEEIFNKSIESNIKPR